MQSTRSILPFSATVHQHKRSLEAFKVVWLFSPSKLSEMNPGNNAIDYLHSFTFLSSFTLGLKKKSPRHIALAQDINPSYDPLLFWKIHEVNLPNWNKAVKSILPSSAASKRIFFFLRNFSKDVWSERLSGCLSCLLPAQYEVDMWVGEKILLLQQHWYTGKPVDVGKMLSF